MPESQKTDVVLSTDCTLYAEGSLTCNQHINVHGFFVILRLASMRYVACSDGSEPSWLEPELELKDFQLGSARLVAFSSSARNRKLAENEPKFLFF